MSPDFRFHSVAVAFKSVLGVRDSERFEYQAYAITTYGEDGLTNYFRTTFDKYVDITDLTYADFSHAVPAQRHEVAFDRVNLRAGRVFEIAHVFAVHAERPDDAYPAVFQRFAERTEEVTGGLDARVE